jgi:hypothetical protein
LGVRLPSVSLTSAFQDDAHEDTTAQPEDQAEGEAQAQLTWRINREVWSLRSPRLFRALERVMYAGAKDDFRVVHYAFQKDHIHLIVEAFDRGALSHGMKGLGVRVARAVNRIMNRRGNVVPDRYHANILLNPTMVRNARRYLLKNAFKHYGIIGPDPFASQTPLVAPHTWLLKQQE